MGAVSSLFLEDEESLLQKLQDIVQEYEAFNSTIYDELSIIQNFQNNVFHRRFKDTYNYLIKETAIHPKAEALLTRFRKVELRINKLIAPSVYNYGAKN